MNQDQNPLITAINTVIVNFTQQIVEQATKPLVERIARLEQQQEELYDIIGISLKGHVNNAVNISMAAVKQGITKEVLDMMDGRIKTSIASIKAEDINGLSDAIEEVLQDQPALSADDINGLDEFVRAEIDERVDTDTMESDLIHKVKDALREAADSL